jgi:hypothetical protein
MVLDADLLLEHDVYQQTSAPRSAIPEGWAQAALIRGQRRKPSSMTSIEPR